MQPVGPALDDEGIEGGQEKAGHDQDIQEQKQERLYNKVLVRGRRAMVSFKNG